MGKVFGVVMTMVLLAGCGSDPGSDVCCEGNLFGAYIVAECGERFCVDGNAYQCVGVGNAIEDGLCGHDAGPGMPDSGPMLDPTSSCSDTCAYAGDGECDDGGPGAAYAVCALGTDCTDCGPREPSEPTECDCTGRECGNDGCGGTCGTCAAFETCSPAGRCEGCVPDCAGRECGGDGCGGTCGSFCSGSDVCRDGRCEADPDGVRMGAACRECDSIYESLGSCFQSGSAVVATCGGTSSGDPANIPYCRRGIEASGGYCTISCQFTTCPSGFTCADTGSGTRGCLRN